MKFALFALVFTAVLFAPFAAFAQSVAAGYPSSYAPTVAAANKESMLSIYSTIDSNQNLDRQTRLALFKK